MIHKKKCVCGHLLDVEDAYQQGREDAIDERNIEKDITDDFYHEKYDTISCPHCGRTLTRFVCMPHCYCYVCGGKFGEIKLSAEQMKEKKDDKEEI